MPALRRLSANQTGGRPRSRFYLVARRIAERFEGQVSQSVLDAIVGLKDSIDLGALESALRSGSAAQVEAAVAASRLEALLRSGDALEATLNQTTTVMGNAGAVVLTNALGTQVGFNARDPNAVLFAREQTARFVVGVGEDVRESIRIMIAAGQDFGLTTRQQARAVRSVVGLPPNWARTPLNLRQDILDGNVSGALGRRLSAADKARIRSRIQRGTVTEAFADEMADIYATRLTNLRARTIARTETAAAANHGMRTGWRQARDDGALPRTTTRHVIVTPDERLRETHAAVPGMNRGGVGLDEPFDTPWGPLDGPPWAADPFACRCSEGLSFSGQRGVL